MSPAPSASARARSTTTFPGKEALFEALLAADSALKSEQLSALLETPAADGRAAARAARRVRARSLRAAAAAAALSHPDVRRHAAGPRGPHQPARADGQQPAASSRTLMQQTDRRGLPARRRSRAAGDAVPRAAAVLAAAARHRRRPPQPSATAARSSARTSTTFSTAPPRTRQAVPCAPPQRRPRLVRRARRSCVNVADSTGVARRVDGRYPENQASWALVARDSPLAGCAAREPAIARPSPQPARRKSSSVATAAVVEEPVTRFIRVSGTLAAQEEAEVAAEVAGRVDRDADRARQPRRAQRDR